MFWKIIGLLGAGTFIITGMDILGDPNCVSVSFRGGGARSVVSECSLDRSGDFSQSTAGLGLILIGLSILAFLFWQNILRFAYSLARDSKQKPESSSVVTEEDSLSLIPEALRSHSEPTRIEYDKKKLAAVGVILIVAFSFFAAPKISFFDKWTCSSLRNEVVSLDIEGKSHWNRYQDEVAILGRMSWGDPTYPNQTSTVLRRALELLRNDEKVEALLKNDQRCLVSSSLLEMRIKSTQDALDYLTGKKAIGGRYFSVEFGWPMDFYRGYAEFEIYVRK